MQILSSFDKENHNYFLFMILNISPKNVKDIIALKKDIFSSKLFISFLC